MANIVAAAVMSVLAIQFRILPVFTECLDTESEEFRDMKARITLMNRKMQDFVTYQVKFRNLERKVLVREQSAARLEMRLKTTEGELGNVKMELGRRQRGATEFTSGSSIRERAGGSEESLDVEEWLRRERVERQIQEAKLQTTVQTLMQADEEVRKKLDNATDNVQKIQDKVSDLEAGNTQLNVELDDMRRILELVTNASEERRGPPLSAEQSRSKLNEFLKDVEELNLFEAAENHSHLMDAVSQLSQRLGKLTEVTESTKKEIGALTSNSRVLLTTVTDLRRDIDLVRDVVEKEKPWEDYTIREMGSLEEKMKAEINNMENTTEITCKSETSDLKLQIENVSMSISQLQSKFEENEASRKREQDFRKNLLNHIDQVSSASESSASMSQETIDFGLSSRSSGTLGNIPGQTSQKSNVVANIRRGST